MRSCTNEIWNKYHDLILLIHGILVLNPLINSRESIFPSNCEVYCTVGYSYEYEYEYVKSGEVMCTRTVEAFSRVLRPKATRRTMSVGFLAQTLIDFLLMSCCASKLDSLEFERRTHAQCFALVEDTQWNR